MVRVPPTKIEKSRQTVFLFIFVFLVGGFYSSFLVWKRKEEAWFLGISYLISWIVFFIIWQRDPGYLKPDLSLSFLDMVTKLSPN
jgi:hypothetical protein